MNKAITTLWLDLITVVLAAIVLVARDNNTRLRRIEQKLSRSAVRGALLVNTATETTDGHQDNP